MPPEIKYDDATHKYWVQGQAVPSVTQVLGILDKPALPWWGMTTGVSGVCQLYDQGVEIPWKDAEGVTKLLTEHKLTVNHVRDTAATRGTSLHDALEQWAQQRKVPILSDFPTEDRGYVQALAKFLIEVEPECLDTEVVTGSAVFGYAGRFDLRCRIDGRTGLLDLKTSKRLYDAVHLQLAGYAIADEECQGRPSGASWALRLGADGKYELLEGQGTGEMFLSVLEAYKALQGLKAKVRAHKRELKAAA